MSDRYFPGLATRVTGLSPGYGVVAVRAFWQLVSSFWEREVLLGHPSIVEVGAHTPLASCTFLHFSTWFGVVVRWLRW